MPPISPPLCPNLHVVPNLEVLQTLSFGGFWEASITEAKLIKSLATGYGLIPQPYPYSWVVKG